jgi:hypothetical protein
MEGHQPSKLTNVGSSPICDDYKSSRTKYRILFSKFKLKTNKIKRFKIVFKGKRGT